MLYSIVFFIGILVSYSVGQISNQNLRGLHAELRDKKAAEQFVVDSVLTMFRVTETVYHHIHTTILLLAKEGETAYEFTVLCNPDAGSTAATSNLRGSSRCLDKKSIKRYWPEEVEAPKEMAALILESKKYLISGILAQVGEAFPEAKIILIGNKHCCPFYRITW
jgi:hypothetical protein